MGSESGDWGTDAFERSPVRPDLRSGVADSLRGATVKARDSLTDARPAFKQPGHAR